MYRHYKTFIHQLIIASLMFFVTACSTDHITPDGKLEKFSFVDVDGALLPVMAAGKATSDIAIIFVHGGPGNSGILFRRYKGLFDLEDDYKMIYYDQRASGVTQGNSNSDEITIEQFSDDLDVIVDFTREVIGAEQIFILGHSWGGGLSTYYLLDDDHQDKITGYMAIAPAFNVVKAMSNSRTVMLAIAEAFVNLNVRAQYWRGAVDFYNANPVITQDLFLDHLEFVEEADGINASQPQEVSVDLPDYQIQAFAQNLFSTQANMTIGGEPIFNAMELDDQMSAITLPTFLMWGRERRFNPGCSTCGF